MGSFFRASAATFMMALASSCGIDELQTPTYAIGLFPKAAHTGFHAGTSFRVLVATSGTQAEWNIADPTIASIRPVSRPSVAKAEENTLKALEFAEVSPLRAGQTTIVVNANGQTASSTLVIKAYTTEQLAVGRARYESPSSEASRRPCAECHAKSDGVDHSPLKMAGFDDNVVLGVIEKATYPESPSGQSVTSSFAPTGPLKEADHKWSLTADERVGILAHLRALPITGMGK